MVNVVVERVSSIPRAPTRIIEATLEDVTEHGIDGACVDQIVRCAGVSKLLFYYYFESKEEVYKLVLEDAAEHAISLLLEQDYQDMSAESAIRMFFRHIFNQYMEMPFLIKFTTDQEIGSASCRERVCHYE